MQHNRITMLSSSETCHLGSSSNNQVIDQQSLLGSNPTVDEHNLLPDTLESENYTHYVLNSHEVGMPSGSMIGQQNTSLSLWDSAGSSSMGFLGDHDSLLQAKREHLAPSLSIGGPLIIEGRRRESSSSLPSQLNIDLNLNQADQFETGNADMVQSSGQSGMSAFPLNRGLSTTEHVLRREISPGLVRSSSHAGSFFDDIEDQETGGSSSHTVNHFCSSIKRKFIHGSLAESSSNGSSRNRRQNNNMLLPSPSSPESTDSLSMPTSTNYGFSYPPIEQSNRNTDTSADDIFPGPRTLSGHLLESERFLRNTRMRMSANDYDESLPNLLPEGSFRCSARQPAQQQSSFTPVQPRAMSSSASSHNCPHVPAVAQFSQSLYQPPSNSNFGSRAGSSSSSVDTINLRSASQDSGRSLTRSNLPEPFLLGPSMFSTDSTSLLSAPGSRSNQQNSSSSSTLRASANVGPQQVPGLNVSQPSSAARGSTDIPRRSSLSASVAHSRSSSIALPQRGNSSSLHEIRSHQPGSSSRASMQHYSRAVPPSIDRQNPGYLDLQSFMQSIAASREGSRTVSELRSVFEQLRQGRSAARLEDFLADRSLIRRASLIDRHREMRLDVDNMSYEELLALGERIGHVSTGLSEEKIMSGLKQWKYLHISLEEPPTTVVEPCCICQEDYADGEDMGRVECGHYFHTACIKQWLVIKNTCPICKKAALGT
uniref:Uncharacterized protein n=1 Tax=Avena sativa TaxID=4498 RepID=A0ACD5UX31_AVESA